MLVSGEPAIKTFLKVARVPQLIKVMTWKILYASERATSGSASNISEDADRLDCCSLLVTCVSRSDIVPIFDQRHMSYLTLTHVNTSKA